MRQEVRATSITTNPRWRGQAGDQDDAALLTLPSPQHSSTPTLTDHQFDIYPNRFLHGLKLRGKLGLAAFVVVANKFCPQVGSMPEETLKWAACHKRPIAHFQWQPRCAQVNKHKTLSVACSTSY